jgi:hypothetical protein
MSILTAIVDIHSVLGVAVGAVATVSSQKVYAWVSKQSKSAVADAEALAAKAKAAATAEVKKVV